jgi:hypothetical protein
MPKVKRDIDIERLLIWAYQVERVDVVRKGRVGPGGYVDSCLRVETMFAGGMSSGKADCHPDADIVHDHVLRLGEPASGLVIEHAKAGSRPDACEGVRFEDRRALNSKGREVVLYDGNRHPVGYKMERVAVHSDGRVECGAVDELISCRRMVYSVWYDALLALQASLAGCIDDWNPKRPDAKQTPWGE